MHQPGQSLCSRGRTPERHRRWMAAFAPSMGETAGPCHYLAPQLVPSADGTELRTVLAIANRRPPRQRPAPIASRIRPPSTSIRRMSELGWNIVSGAPLGHGSYSGSWSQKANVSRFMALGEKNERAWKEHLIATSLPDGARKPSRKGRPIRDTQSPMCRRFPNRGAERCPTASSDNCV